jgi:hypothetical protein
VALEQERQGLAVDAFVRVVAAHGRNGAGGVVVAADDRRGHGEQFAGHGDDPFAFGLRRRDHEQRDGFAVGP